MVLTKNWNLCSGHISNANIYLPETAGFGKALQKEERAVFYLLMRSECVPPTLCTDHMKDRCEIELTNKPVYGLSLSVLPYCNDKNYHAFFFFNVQP